MRYVVHALNGLELRKFLWHKVAPTRERRDRIMKNLARDWKIGAIALVIYALDQFTKLLVHRHDSALDRRQLGTLLSELPIRRQRVRFVCADDELPGRETTEVEVAEVSSGAGSATL